MGIFYYRLLHMVEKFKQLFVLQFFPSYTMHCRFVDDSGGDKELTAQPEKMNFAAINSRGKVGTSACKRRFLCYIIFRKRMS